MVELLLDQAPLMAAFAVIAFVYASVGFGGGSSYTALLAVSGMSAAAIPVLSLGCNLVVAGGGSLRFFRAGHFPVRRMGPLLLLSLPAAFVAGSYRLAPGTYLLLLGLALATASLLLMLRAPSKEEKPLRPFPLSIALVVGGALGTLSGLTGIGGGIYLSPLLMLRRWATPKEAAATASLYILLNSLAGLAGQLSKPGAREALHLLPGLIIAVLIGGSLGSSFGAGKLPARRLRQLTAILIGLVAVRILFQRISGWF